MEIEGRCCSKKKFRGRKCLREPPNIGLGNGF
jgi:hypothetical protein